MDIPAPQIGRVFDTEIEAEKKIGYCKKTQEIVGAIIHYALVQPKMRHVGLFIYSPYSYSLVLRERRLVLELLRRGWCSVEGSFSTEELGVSVSS